MTKVILEKVCLINDFPNTYFFVDIEYSSGRGSHGPNSMDGETIEDFARTIYRIIAEHKEEDAREIATLDRAVVDLRSCTEGALLVAPVSLEEIARFSREYENCKKNSVGEGI